LGRVFRRWVLRPGKKRGDGVGKTKRGKGTKWMVVVDGQGVPLACHLDSASPAEVKLLEPTLDGLEVQPTDEEEAPPQPGRLICDKAYDSDGLRERLLFERDIDLICPHRRNRTRVKLQDGRKLKRYKRRWKVERTFAWLSNFRRLVVRYERSLKMYRAFFHVACLLITLKKL
jgi:transposase